MIPWLGRALNFPAPDTALDEPNGLLAAGGDLSCQRLLLAYSQGIFPWYAPGEPILWWSPSPRMVLFPERLRVTRSLDKVLRNSAYEVRCDTAFEAVIAACARTPRSGQVGTWISAEMQQAYVELHRQGFAHSFETWVDGRLVGGLYGVCLGRMFYGESMFHHARDASKIALVHMVRHLGQAGLGMVDCQMHTPHLESLGGQLVPRPDFAARLKQLLAQTLPESVWTYRYCNEPT